MFKITVVQAEFGDCLLLHYGSAQAPRHLLIDGGPPTTFERHLRHVLRQVGQPAKLDLVMLSHVDADHVVGLLDLFAHIAEQRANGEEEMATVASLWHNSFADTIGHGTSIEPRLRSMLAAAPASMAATSASVLGIQEGASLRVAALQLGIPINNGFSKKLICVDDQPAPIKLDNLSLRVVGPTRANLKALQEEWEAWLQAHEDAVNDPAVAAMADKSVPNLSSIMVLAVADGRRVLLTGDGRGDHLLDGLSTAGLLDADGNITVDILKVAHHGSDRNATRTFFRHVRADTYLVSANGKDSNPDLATMIWIVETAKDQKRPITLTVTNETPSTRKLMEEYPPAEYGYTLRTLTKGRHALTLAAAAADDEMPAPAMLSTAESAAPEVRLLASYRSFAAFASQADPMPAPMTLESAGAPAGQDEDAEMWVRITEALSQLEEEQRGRAEGVLTSVPDRVASLMQTWLLEHPPAAKPRGEPVDVDPNEIVLEVKYDEKDIAGWIGSLFTWWKGIKDEPWLPPPATPETIGGEQLRVALLSDWGTGLYGAPICANSIAQGSFDVVMHLGDVYYSGSSKEVERQFLRFWPRPGNAVSRALNGNHEMYTGGEGYFKIILKDFKQSSSCWAMQNAHWLLVGLDSAYKDHNLTDDQLPWLEKLIAGAGSRKIILLSHHQPFSLLDNQGPNLVDKLGALLTSSKIFAWYWGHEHRCVLYDRHPVWKMFGRCIGHGGYPSFRDKLGHLPTDAAPYWRRHPPKNLVPGGLILDAPNPYISGEEEKYGANGYVTLDFDGLRVTETVRSAEGKSLRETKLA